MGHILKVDDLLLFEYVGKGKEVWRIISIRRNKDNNYNIDAKVLKRGIDYESEVVNHSMKNGFGDIPSIDLDEWKVLTGMNGYRFTLLTETEAVLEVL